MHIDEKTKLKRGIEIIEKISIGINPINGEAVLDDFYKDERMQRFFNYVKEVLLKNEEKEERKESRKMLRSERALRKNNEFFISKEQKLRVIFPENNITISEFCKIINNTTRENMVLEINYKMITRELIKLGILDEVVTEKGNTKAVINSVSKTYGVVLEERKTIMGNTYNGLMLSEKGKQFLLNNLEKIVSSSGEI